MKSYQWKYNEKKEWRRMRTNEEENMKWKNIEINVKRRKWILKKMMKMRNEETNLIMKISKIMKAMSVCKWRKWKYGVSENMTEM